MNFHSARSHWVFPGTVRLHRKKPANLKMKSFDLGFVRRRVAIMSQQAHKGFHMVCDPSSSLLIHHHALWHTSQRGFAFLHSIVLVCWISSRCFEILTGLRKQSEEPAIGCARPASTIQASPPIAVTFPGRKNLCLAHQRFIGWCAHI